MVGPPAVPLLGWPDTSEPLDGNTGLPLLASPVVVDVSHVWRYTIGQDGTRLRGVRARARTVAISTCEGALEVQLRDASVVAARAADGSQWLDHRAIVAFPDRLEAVYLDAVLWVPAEATDLLDAEYGIDLEVYRALLPLWFSWLLADPSLVPSGAYPMPVLSRAVDLLCEGTPWL